MSDTTILVLFAVFVLVQGFFSGSEIALVSADRLRLQADAGRGRRSAVLALEMLERPAYALGTCLIGTNSSVITVATLMVVLVTRHLDAPGALATVVAVPVTLTFGEMVPKAIFQHHADRLVNVVIFPLRAFATAFAPVLWLIDLVYRVLGGRADDETPAVTRQELRLLLEGTRSEALSPHNQALIRRVFAFTEATVEDAMVPLIEVTAVPVTATLAEAAERISQTGHSRLPVYRDRVDDIIGMIPHHDLLAAEDWTATVESILRPIMYVPESKQVDELLLEMQRLRQRLAVAVDEYGGAVGIITAEDMLEEIVGEIEDESDKARPLVRRTGENEWTASARAEREHIEQATGLLLPDGDFETVAGFLLSAMGRVPRVGESTTVKGFTIEVSRATERAILEVKLRGRR